MGRMRNLWALLALVLLSVSIHDFYVSADVIPSENECRPYIEKAIHELKNVEVTGTEDDKELIESTLEDTDSIENEAAPEAGTEEDGNESVEENAEKSLEEEAADENKSDDAETPSQENQTEETASVEDAAPEANENSSQEGESKEQNDSADEAAATEGEEKSAEQTDDSANESAEANTNEETESKENDADSKEANTDSVEGDSKEGDADSKEANADSVEGDSKEQVEEGDSDSKENEPEAGTDSKENDSKENESAQTEEKEDQDSTEPAEENESEQANEGSNEESTEGEKTDAESVEEGENQTAENEAESKEEQAAEGDSKESSENDSDNKESEQSNDDESVEEKVRAKRSLPDEAGAPESDESTQANDNESQEAANESLEAANESPEATNESLEAANESPEAANESLEAGNESQEANSESQEAAAVPQEEANTSDGSESQETAEESVEDGEKSEEEQVEATAEDLTIEFEIPKNLRPRTHVAGLLGLDAESSVKENALRKTGDVVLKELKRVFDNAIHPLESMYKYRDLSNRHFGDPEIFSKPLVLFMGPWSGGKSTILNYLTDNEYTANSIRSGAEPSPAYFNIMMHGDEPEVLDGTQLAADWTFSGLQKFGQGLMDRLRGQKLPNKLLERVNIVEIPGILEVRKQVSKYFPFNDACQWFIDRADIIFLVYDPSKLDVGPETEAILDQLKGREYQTRILLNKADQVKPEELLRVQGALIWNISPLMSSAQPPVMYTVSLWSHPFEHGAPVRLLQAQERAFLTDLREAIDRRIENKIASARRFAVRIRNHAKMVDCYLTTYYNQKGLFSNKKQTADKIIEHPQNYNIYEGLSTLTNISRYDLPDPEVYMDFFRLNPLYEFKKLAETCTYFKGCPINKLDIAIAYDLPELVGKYKKLQEQNLIQLRKEYDDNCNQTEAELPVKIINSR